MDLTIEQISEHVWYLPPHPDPQKIQPLVGIIVGEDETVLVDAGNTPATAGLIQSEVKRIGAPPVNKVIYTHHHWDHVFGANVHNARIIAHARCKTLLASEAAKPWSRAFLESEVKRDSSLEDMATVLRTGIEDWSKFSVVVLNTIFEDVFVIEGKGYSLELEHVGGKHAPDSVTVKVVGESVMFLGDSFYPAPLRLNPTDTSLDSLYFEPFWELITRDI